MRYPQIINGIQTLPIATAVERYLQAKTMLPSILLQQLLELLITIA
jgi:hypothetical protein